MRRREGGGRVEGGLLLIRAVSESSQL